MKKGLVTTLALALALAVGVSATAEAHTLSLRKARREAKSALYVATPWNATNTRVSLSDCWRWSRHKVICSGSYEKEVEREYYDSCAHISYYGNCYGGYETETETYYCNATINVRFESRRSRYLKTWVHSKECF